MGWFSGTIEDEAAGRKSRSAFIAMAAFWIAAFRFLTHDLSFELGARGHQFLKMNFGKMDATLLAAFLMPCLGLYFGRRYWSGSKAEISLPEKPPGPQEVPKEAPAG